MTLTVTLPNFDSGADTIFLHLVMFCIYVFQCVRVYEFNNCSPSFVKFDMKSVSCVVVVEIVT